MTLLISSRWGKKLWLTFNPSPPTSFPRVITPLKYVAEYYMILYSGFFTKLDDCLIFSIALVLVELFQIIVV